ncbi:ABSCISIC ACID-INSENSITIVE 5-like protein 5 [Euphorbia lathyris]|uniref:ABSCISIC ACID-INSENSITIVE 5-like protein 5 n=1 Tax=Euphorbia lathyris TaxID=212925 RepID=UPI0033141324
MASSKLMPTTSTSNPDLPRQSSLCSADLLNQNHFLSQDQFSSITMDDFLKNIYSYPTPTDPHPDFPASASISRQGSFSFPKETSAKSADDVWKEIVAGASLDQRREGIEGMTLEDFLTKAGAVREEDVRLPLHLAPSVLPYAAVDNKINTENTNTNYDNAHFQGVANGNVMPEAGKGRQKRRAVEEPPMDKATQQKQRRMIKNRESAARSRERKQAYTIELESLVTQLEEENAKLAMEEGEKKKQRVKELMKNLIPVTDKRRPPRALRRVNSVQW